MKLLLLICLLQKLQSPAVEPETLSVRALYYKSATDKVAFMKLSRALENVNMSSPPVLVCYKGAAELVNAKYAINPYTKLKDFNAGKILIEKAVKLDSTVIETRFLRFAIQTNLPSFLGYNDSVMADKHFLITHFKNMSDLKLKADIYNYLIGSVYCTKDDLRILKPDN